MNRWQRRFLGSTSLSYDLTDFELAHFFALTDHERHAVRSRYKPNHRMAAAIQIGFLKLAGRPLAAFKVLPAPVLEYVATQLGERAPTIASLRALYKRRATRFAHQAWAIDLLALESFSHPHRTALKKFLDTEARTTSSVKVLIQIAREWLYDRHILIPAESTLREVAVPAYKQSDQFHFEVICAAVPEKTRACWIDAIFTRKDGETRTVVDWLQEPPRKRSPSTLTRQFKKIAYLTRLGLAQYDLAPIAIEKQRLYAQRFRGQRPARFRHIVEPRRTLELVCFLRVTLLDTTDSALALIGKTTADVVRHMRDRVAQLERDSLRTHHTMIAGVARVLADQTLSDKTARDIALAMVCQPGGQLFPSKAAAARFLLSEAHPRIRSILTALTSWDLQGRAEAPVKQAVQRLRELYANHATALAPGDDVPHPRLWSVLIQGEDRTRAFRAFEAATLLELRRALKRGTVWLPHSAVYRNPDQLLISPQRWAHERSHHYAALHLPVAAGHYVQQVLDMLDAGLKGLAEAIQAGHVRIDGNRLHLPALTAEPPPAEILPLKETLFKEIGTAQLPEVMLEIDGITRFSWHLLGSAPKSGDELIALYSALIAHGTALEAAGVARMTPGQSAERIVASMEKFETKPVLQQANNAVVGFLRSHPIARVWGDGRFAAADMMSLDASKHLWTARMDPRRRTHALGVYSHVLDQWGLVYDQPILLNERQAGAAIEGAIRQTMPRIERVAVDTHGYTNAALAVGRLLRLDILPRLKNLKERKLYIPRGILVPTALDAIVDRTVSLRTITAQWDNLVRLAASIESGVVTADVALARFTSRATAGEGLHRAADHLGKLLRTIFLCDYLANDSFRREIHRILGHGEAVHSLQRIIYFGPIPVRRARRHEEAVALSGSLTLLTNISLAWTTYHIQRVLHRWAAEQGGTSAPAWVRYVSPARSAHLNFRGIFQYPLERYAERLLQTASPSGEHRTPASAPVS